MSTAVRGRYAKGEERRRRILEAGVRVFASHGYRAGSIQRIADEVGISMSGLLHHFDSKAALLAAILERRDDLSRDFLDAETRKGVELLRGLVELTAYNQTVPGLVELHCTLSAEATGADHPAHAYFVDRYASVLGMLETAFRDAGAAGELAAEAAEPAEAARDVTALMDGLQVQWLLSGGAFDMAARVRAHLQRQVVVPL
ncbi:TetR/AcrR family transcriptional regulator [Microbacterium marinilacus]|uniref:TetR/AcrR family transcriptional regulator n=1 Tax=Microbacterium marinilacus TaxID=415209 RepID=A0ABP7B8W8_9MICO|nr:TetR/AcrR family transcriptional regulator [Microbacterium marinilacus]MBY0687291.1 TetR/AcrR family transcriptional regulator [Microbacterium marinilacus]